MKRIKIMFVVIFFIAVVPSLVILGGQVLSLECNNPFEQKAPEPAACQNVLCGDHVCDVACGERANSPDTTTGYYCPGDCCPALAVCGNGVCDSGCGESKLNCKADCI